jgi:hypothetical protein
MNNHEQNDPQGDSPSKVKLAKPWQKFLIGFVGGFCAAISPRLMAFLTLSGGSDIVLINAGYFGVAVLFAALVGAVVMIWEWGEFREPRATFMTALGLPALLAGALNTTNGAYELNNHAKENSELVELVQSLSDIPEISEGSLIPLTDARGTGGSINAMAFLGIGVAYAAGDEVEQDGLDLNPSIQIQKSRYVIVLERAQSEEEAKDRASVLKSDIPFAQAVRVGNKFLIIDSEPRPRSEAVLEAIRLKKKHSLKPALLRVKR